MKASIPESVKNELPQSKWGKVLGVTPVVMTVVATMLAGLSSSEMTRAQYDRSLAAQLQSKAGDQWNFFQGKKLRSALQHNTLDVLTGTGELPAPERTALTAALAGTPAAAALESPGGQAALAALLDGILPKPGPAPAVDANVQAAWAALDASRPDPELVGLLAAVTDRALEDALRSARAQALALDALIRPVSEVVDLVEKQLGRPSTGAELRHQLTAARLGYNGRRYEAEARLNQNIASLYELQVRKSNLSAERHHRRSQIFFYAMLAAQMGVIIATLAMAAQKRNLLWSIAASAGAVALSFAAYVYLFV